MSASLPALSASKGSRQISLLFAAAVSASLICAIAFDIKARTEPKIKLTAGFLAEVDQDIGKLPGTDVFVRLKNLPPSADGFMRMLYCRGNFAAYPHRVLMGDPTVPMDYRHDPLQINFDPSDPWLLEHQIGGEITLELNDRRHFICSVERIEPGGRQPQ